MDDSTKELKQIFEGQSAMAETVKALHNKMDQILGKKKLWDHGKNQKLYNLSKATENTTKPATLFSFHVLNYGIEILVFS